MDPIQALIRNPVPRAYLCLTTTAFCWGCNAVFARLSVGEVSPMLIVTLRWLGAVLLIVAISGRTLMRDRNLLSAHWPRLMLMGALGFAAFNAFFYVSAHSTTALNLGIIQGAIPVFVLLGGLLIYGTPVTLVQVTGVIMTICGVCVVASAGDLQRLTELSVNKGDYLMIFACLLYAGYALNLRKFPGISPLLLFAVLAGAAFAASIPMTIVEIATGGFQWPTLKGWVIVALITLLPSFVAQITFIQGVSDIGPGRAGVFVNLVPVFASVLAVSVVGEAFKWYHAVSLALVVLGIGLAERKSRS